MSLRRTVLVVAALNAVWFFVQMSVALAIGSVSLLADGVDYLEDTAVNLLIAIALGWSLTNRSRMGKVMAFVILIPALIAAWQAFTKFRDPFEPDTTIMLLAAVGSVIVNGLCAWFLVHHRRGGGSMTKAAWLAARNDVIINIAIIAMALLTMAVGSGWPDLVLGVIILVINLGAAKEVWEAATEENLAAKAEAGETGCGC